MTPPLGVYYSMATKAVTKIIGFDNGPFNDSDLTKRIGPGEALIVVGQANRKILPHILQSLGVKMTA